MKQNSDTRAQRQHSTVSVDKGLPNRQANLRAHRQHSATGVNRNTFQHEPSVTLPLNQRRPDRFATATGSRNFRSTVESEAAPGSLFDRTYFAR
jgi:hypothetical protein